MHAVDLCSLLEKIDNPAILIQNMVHRVPKSSEYWPVVSTIIGIAKGALWIGVYVAGCAMTAAGFLASPPAYLLGKTVDLLTGHPRGDFGGNFAFFSGSVAILGAFMAIGSAFSFLRVTISMVPVLGNVTLLVWDEINEQEQRKKAEPSHIETH